MLLHLDGFDSYAALNDLYQEYYLVVAGGFSTSAGRFGGGAVQLTGNTQGVYWASPTGITDIWTGFAFQKLSTNIGSAGSIISFGSVSGVESTIWYDPSTGTWTAWRGQGSGTTVLGTNVFAISLNTYHWVEIHYSISTTVGIIEVWVDGTQVLNLTGLNNTQTGQTSFNSIILGLEYYTCSGNFDDWYILDTTGSYNNTRLGDSRIETLRPSSDAGPNDGVPSTSGAHYAMVNEMQWNTSNSIVLGSTSGNAEVFGMTSLSTAPTTIHGVRVLAVVEKTDGGTLLANAIVKSSGVEADGNSTVLTTSFNHAFNIFEVDPNTNSPWTTPAINSMDCGFKIL